MAATATATATLLSSSICAKHASESRSFFEVPWHRNRMFGKKRTSLTTSWDTDINRLVVVAVTQGSAESSNSSDEKIPSWAKPDSDEPPPWARAQPNNNNDAGFVIPFYVYLFASAITAIAAIGSIFEYVNQRPVFGILRSDSVFYAPLLGFFVFTGIPSSAFLWFKSVEVANKEAEEQDKRDGYL